ncbi:hypothetical protein B0H21DRAFT_249280 [Amylocystis lapponica]|nr:hypothetical protein B0H21DRAFT_249280 [Amylocystis lapponica]
MTSKQPIGLDIRQDLYVAGGIIQGYVELNLPLLQEDRIGEVHVKLRGFARTVIHNSNATSMGTVGNDHEKIVTLIRETTSVWTRGQTFPPPGSHTLRLPFRFLLPEVLPPSFHLSAKRPNDNATVQYYVEAVGTRLGAFHFNRRVTRPVAVLPPGTADALLLRKSLMMDDEWSGKWTTISRESKIRRGIWGSFSTIHMECSMPDVKEFPLFTRIPFSIKVMSMSKPMKQNSASEDKPTWPAVPILPKDVNFELRHRVHIRVDAFKTTFRERIGYVGGMGNSNSGDAAVVVDTPEKVWVPSEGDGETGSWKQETTFTSSIEFKCSPTFTCETMDNEYFLRLNVGFGGLFNSLTAEFDVRIVSAMPAPAEPPPLALAEDAGVPPYPGEVDNMSALLVLDLPPSYWTVADWEDRKKRE